MPDPFNGRQLGKYVIQQEIGRGGMARVYRGLDTVLQRPVALKVLAPSLSADPEFARRFEREAITAANLRHPAIVTIFDVGEADGLRYIAMEYIAGRTLNDVLQEQGRLGLPLAIAIVGPVAEALDFAHSHGMVHRDVKPHNIMIDTDGRVLLTDFGIAIDPAESGERLTRTGMFMGTPEYISPEQAQAQPLGGRSDIYSLGVVTYEMLAGRVPFEGGTPQQIMAHVYQTPPAITSFDPTSPPELDQIMGRALAKDPQQRFERAVAMVEAMRFVARRYNLGASSRQDVAALAIPRGSSAGQPTVAMRTPPGLPVVPGQPPAQRGTASPVVPAPYPIADVFGPAATGGQARPPAAAQRPPAGQAPTMPMATPPAGIPANGAARPGQGAPPRGPGSRGYSFPGNDDQFGPPPRIPRRRGYADDDESSVPWTFLALGAIAVAAIVLVIVLSRGGGNNGLSVGGSSTNNPFVVVPTSTTQPTITPLRTPTFGGVPTAVPNLSPVPAEELPATVTAQSTPEPTAEPTLEPTAEPTLEPTPTAEPTLEPTPTAEPTLEPTPTGEPTAEPTPTAQPSSTPLTLPTATPFASGAPTPTGGSPTLIFFEDNTLAVFDQARNSIERYQLNVTDIGPTSVSPDGAILLVDAVDARSGRRHIFAIERTRNRITQLSKGDGDHFHASWRPDGQQIVFASTRAGEADLYVMDPDGNGVRLLTPEPGEHMYPSFSPDGSRIVFESTREEQQWALFTMDAQGGLVTRLSTPGKIFNDRQPRWSPDGQQIVFVSDRDRTDSGFEVYAQRLDGSENLRLTTFEQGTASGPTWSPDGQLIAFFADPNGTNDIFSVSAAGGEPQAVLSTSANERWPNWGQ